jgi:hypothetical protein
MMPLRLCFALSALVSASILDCMFGKRDVHRYYTPVFELPTDDD